MNPPLNPYEPLSFLWFLLAMLIVLTLGYVVIKLSANVGSMVEWFN